MGGSSPDKAGVRQYRQMVWGPVSRSERSTRGTDVITPLNAIPARTWRIWAGSGAHHPRTAAGGNSPGGVKPATGRLQGRSAAYSRRGRWGRVGLLLRRANHSEHGNHLRSARLPRFRRGWLGWVRRQPIGRGWGGAAVVLRAGESPAHGEGRQRNRGDEDAARPKDAPVNTGAPTERRWGRGGGYRRCRPSFTVGRRPMLVAGSMTCSTSCMIRRR